GKIIVVGAVGDDFSVVRYTAAGAFDTSFGTNGRVTTDFGATDKARAAAVQADGKIVVAGVKSTVEGGLITSDFALARYNADGSLDGSFGTGGKQVTDFGSAQDELNGVLAQPDGKIVVVGSTLSGGFDFALARYSTDGTLDNSFDGDGKVTTDFTGSLAETGRGVAAQADGKVIVVGTASNGRSSDFALVRYLTSGALDPAFGTGGRVTTRFDAQSRANAVLVQSDGKIVAA